MIADNIPKTENTLQERGLPDDSYFEVVFKDGSSVSEVNTNWSAFSKREIIDCFGHKQACFISIYPIRSIKIKLNGLEAFIDEVPDGVEVYQFMRSERVLANNIDKDSVIGRGIGMIKDGAVIEERFINAYENKVQGMRI